MGTDDQDQSGAVPRDSAAENQSAEDQMSDGLSSIYDKGKPPETPSSLQKESQEKDPDAELGGKMTFLEHLDELRKRILHSVIAIAVAFLGAWIFREEIFRFLRVPIDGVVDDLIVIRPTEPFTIYMKVAFVAAIFLAAPVILWQVWLFISPGLYRREKAYALPFLFGSTILFLAGGAFAYYIVLPPSLYFLLKIFGDEFLSMISAVEFFNFELVIILGLGVMFQLPILVAFLSIFGLITPRFLWKNFRYAFLLITIVAAVVSPTTDPVMLFLWTGPLVLLYIFSIGICWIFQRRRARRIEMENAGT